MNKKEKIEKAQELKKGISRLRAILNGKGGMPRTTKKTSPIFPVRKSKRKERIK